MLFPLSPRVEDLKQRVTAFMEEHVYPAEACSSVSSRSCRAAGTAAGHGGAEGQGEGRRAVEPVLPGERIGAGLTNLEYAPLCEIMGRSPIGAGGLQLLGAGHRQHGDARPLRHARSKRSSG